MGCCSRGDCLKEVFRFGDILTVISRGGLILAVWTFALPMSSQALGQQDPEQECAAPSVHAGESLDQSWRDKIGELETRLADLAEGEPCAQLEVAKHGDAVFVEIWLADGRMAARRVDAPEALLATVEALLIGLPASQAVQPLSPPNPPSASEALLEPPPGEAAMTPRPAGFALDLGIGAATRVAGAPFFIGYGLVGRLDVSINSWLVGGWLRWDFRDRPIRQEVPRGFTMASFLLGAFVGRRFALGRATLDVVAGPNVVVETEESAGPAAIDLGGEMGALSLGGALKLFTPGGVAPGFFGLLGGELIPDRMVRRVRADPALPVLPRWSATFALGASWSVL